MYWYIRPVKKRKSQFFQDISSDIKLTLRNFISPHCVDDSVMCLQAMDQNQLIKYVDNDMPKIGNIHYQKEITYLIPDDDLVS